MPTCLSCGCKLNYRNKGDYCYACAERMNICMKCKKVESVGIMYSLSGEQYISNVRLPDTYKCPSCGNTQAKREPRE